MNLHEQAADGQPLHFPVSVSLIISPFDCIFGNANKEICLLQTQLQLFFGSKKDFFPFLSVLSINHVYQVTCIQHAWGGDVCSGVGVWGICVCVSQTQCGPHVFQSRFCHIKETQTHQPKYLKSFILLLSKNIHGTLIYDPEWYLKSSFLLSSIHRLHNYSRTSQIPYFQAFTRSSL